MVCSLIIYNDADGSGKITGIRHFQKAYFQGSKM